MNNNNIIIHPLTNEKLNIFSIKGKNLLKSLN